MGNYAENLCKIFSLISVVKFFLKYLLCVTYLIKIKLVRDEDIKPRACFRYFFFVGVWGHATPENFEN